LNQERLIEEEAMDVFELVNFFEQQNTSYEVDGHAGTTAKKEPATTQAE
jgi:hypothetical protein